MVFYIGRPNKSNVLLPFLVLTATGTSTASLARIHQRLLFQTLRLQSHPRSTRLFSTMPVESRLVNEPVQHVSKDWLPDWMLTERTRIITGSLEAKTKHASSLLPNSLDSTTTKTSLSSSVVYWMQRDVRTVDNWAMLLAAHWATRTNRQLHVVYALPPPPSAVATESGADSIPSLVDLPMTERHGLFLLGGLEGVHDELSALHIPLHVVLASSHRTVGETVAKKLLELKCAMMVTDFSPLRHHREWIELQAAPIVRDQLEIMMVQVDTHNVVPVWMASNKREYGARTIRPKIDKQYAAYMQKFPKLKEVYVVGASNTAKDTPVFQRSLYQDYMKMDASVAELPWAKPGTTAGLQQAQLFFDNGLSKFDKLRNDPNQRNICSNMSPWINHGHVSFQRLAMAVKKLNKYANGTAAFIEEGMVRRELSDNFVYYEPYRYDSLSAAYEWAQETLQTHASDPREYVYSLEEFANGETHDDLWNAAQLQAVRDGKMHGFLRMYWAKKILEWTESPEQALQIALYLNDKYNVDGRDPNGFVGVGWSIMGIHDMGWKEREVFGKIRFMNYAGCKRKYVCRPYCVVLFHSLLTIFI